MRRVGVEEAAAIGAEHLDGDLRGDGADGDGLLGAFQRRRVDISAERLRHALPDQKQSIGNADRQQDVERAAGDIDPEIADGLRRGPREAADQRHREHDAGCRREEVLMGEAEHLHEIGQRALATIVLPVGVGDEADGRVEAEIFGHGRHALRIERQEALQAQQAVEDQKAADMEEQHGDRVGQPILLPRLVDAAEAIEAGLDRAQHRRQKGALAVEDSRHVPAERLHQCDNDRAIDRDLNPAIDCHGTPLRTSRA